MVSLKNIYADEIDPTAICKEKKGLSRSGGRKNKRKWKKRGGGPSGERSTEGFFQEDRKGLFWN